MTDLTGSGGSGKNSGGRRSSWDERADRKAPLKSKSISPGVPGGRRYSHSCSQVRLGMTHKEYDMHIIENILGRTD